MTTQQQFANRITFTKKTCVKSGISEDSSERTCIMDEDYEGGKACIRCGHEAEYGMPKRMEKG